MTQGLVGLITNTRKINTKDIKKSFNDTRFRRTNDMYKKINTKDIKISYNDTRFRRTNDMYKKDKYKGQ